MDNFLSLTLRDKELFDYYSDISKYESYEYLFSSLYIWRNFCNTKYQIIDGALIVWKHEQCVGDFFMMPYNYNRLNLESLINSLIKLSNSFCNNRLLRPLNSNSFLTGASCENSIYLFGDVESQFVDDLKNHTSLTFDIDELKDDFEYIYNTKDLINLSGAKYHSKKNHYNAFKRLYDYRITEINSTSIINDCLDLLDRWHETNTKVLCCMELSIERPIIEETLYNLNILSLKSLALYVKDTLVGFCVGEIHGSTAVIHFERCDTSFKGVYAFINREFLKREFSNTLYVNRQEDCGDIGLRQSKESYHPVTMIKKSFIRISNQ